MVGTALTDTQTAKQWQITAILVNLGLVYLDQHAANLLKKIRHYRQFAGQQHSHINFKNFGTTFA